MDQELKKEQQRVDVVQELINQKILNLKEKMGGLKEGIIDIRKTFWEDVTINFDGSDDVIETLTSIKQQVELLAERERTHGQYFKELQQLLRLKDSPYFGRIDFREEGEDGAEKIYIGVTSLMDQHNEEFLIYDWRAPISSLYYDYSPGPASYTTPMGEIKGQMDLKRQYIIKGSQIKSMFDTGVTIGDSLLQAVLGANADAQMKNIVATIQKEQNEIIRNEKGKYLIVQGVAGSGKTSAALQRVAYLLYRYRNTLSSKNIMLFSPNPLFNSYIATVLPELGEENMEQTTYQHYLLSRFGKNFEVEDPFTQMEYTLTAMDDEHYQVRLKSIQFKSSLLFKNLLDEYIQYLSRQGLIFKNIKFRGETLFTQQDISNIFYSFDSNLPIPNRLTLTAEHLLQELTEIEKREQKKEWVLEEAELLSKEDYVKAYKQIEKSERNGFISEGELEEQILARWIVKRKFKPIRQAVKRFAFLNMKAIYRQLFTLEGDFLYPDSWESICKLTIAHLNRNFITYEDATPYLYLQDQLEGRKANTFIRHLVIDEAQDYSPFQFEFLKQLFPRAKMTILGDVNQAIYAHSIAAPSLLNMEIEDAEKIVLTKSYRSTKEIVDFTKNIIPSGHLIEPFNRSGEKPTITEVKDQPSLLQNIKECVEGLKEKGHETTAIICKSAKESQEVYEFLKDQIDVRLIEKDANSYEKGTVILPVYLAKGIEFDAVIVYNASKDVYRHEFERNIFYTACTRAMHELHLYSIGPVTPFV